MSCKGKYPGENDCYNELDSYYNRDECENCPNFGCPNSFECDSCTEDDCAIKEQMEE